MTDLGPYARLYLCIPDDPKFAEVYDDDHHFAAYCRLLMIAEGPWPASAHLPITAQRESVEKLAAVGLIDLQPGSRYRVHGLDAERHRRSESARNAAAQRWHSGRIPTPDATAMPRRDETSIDKTSNAIAREVPDGRDDLEAWLMVRFKPPTEAQRSFLDGYCRTFDQTGPRRAARLILANPTDPIGALKQDLADWRAQRAIEAIASEEPKPVRREGPSPSVLRSRHNSGQHADRADPACPACASVGVA
jgi:hypothetical protein